MVFTLLAAGYIGHNYHKEKSHTVCQNANIFISVPSLKFDASLIHLLLLLAFYFQSFSPLIPQMGNVNPTVFTVSLHMSTGE